MFKRLFCFYFSLALSAICASEDAVHFINVGQGHCTLLARRGRSSDGTPFLPLLVDAGTSYGPPQRHGLGYVWEPTPKEVIANSIAEKIKTIWAKSNEGSPFGWQPVYGLNTIITHGDDDHKNLLPLILTNLSQYIQSQPQNFFFLLGGKQAHYMNEWCPQIPAGRYQYSEAYLKHYYSGEDFSSSQSLLPLSRSGCITDLFLPRGMVGTTDLKNSWSIVVRTQLSAFGAPYSGLSALITGDAEASVQKWITDLLSRANIPTSRLQSDILLFPHHGAAPENKRWSLHPVFHAHVNPRTVVFSAGPGGHNHPKARTLIEVLQATHMLPVQCHRLWSVKTAHHPILYHADIRRYEDIAKGFTEQQRLFKKVPDPRGEWNLVWTDMPLYTLYASGTVVFKSDITRPDFSDAPQGMQAMGYLAVPHPKYLLPPLERARMSITHEWTARIFQELYKFPEPQASKLLDVVAQAAVYAESEEVLVQALHPAHHHIWRGLIEYANNQVNIDLALGSYLQAVFGASPSQLASG